MPGSQPDYSFPESPFSETIRLNKANSRESTSGETIRLTWADLKRIVRIDTNRIEI